MLVATRDGSPRAGPIGRRAVEVERLFDVGVVARCAEPRSVGLALFPDEAAHLERAVLRRRAEFGTARMLAREALADLGFAPCSLVPGPDRAPRWPAGVVGSISHTARRCVVVVASAEEVDAIGVDVEDVEAIDRELVPLVCTEREQAWLRRTSSCHPCLAKLTFSAKEALYKCQYTMTGRYLDFRDVELTLELETSRFRVRALGRLSPAEAACIEAVRGRFMIEGASVVTAAVLHRGACAL